MQTILIVDDEKNMLSVLKMLFEAGGYRVLTASNGNRGLELFEKNPDVDIVISDLKMPEMDGIEFMQEVLLRDPSIPFIIISAYGTIDKAVEAMKIGASDFITKPFNKELILHTIKKVWSYKRLKEENNALRENQKEHNLVFRSRKMHDLLEDVRKAARFPSPVLLTGESGSGKEVIAKAIHAMYQGNTVKPFVSINCPAVPENLLESELFGYKKGAFTGADTDFSGKVRLSDGGTLFLDEIGDIALSIQPKLLKLLENKTIEPLGMATPIRINTRIICATNMDLKELVEQGRFREDLYYRINTIQLHVPPLRERPSDIAPLLEYFLDKYSVELNTEERDFTPEAMKVLESYLWPGNVRELRNFVERTVILSSKNHLGVEDLPESFRKYKLRSLSTSEESPSILSSEDQHLSHIEKRLLEESLAEFQGNISAAARKLGITRNTMRYRLKKHGISFNV